ncbi:hypothetical protein [Streptomyces sp. MP131-18]|uniref:hypothetical protein n=1 Tax=Streptomyces sp. MP131-18 TaxID=1857892 RepID=UPI00097C2BA4|nr:hypothetical protein [Streptomyces sp. MP131-18]ONK16198.1 hypothetical protein STBA_70480 [Streptomyces sp. MP131-18]
MEYQQLLVGLAFGMLTEDNGSGPPPAIAGHEADRRRSSRAEAQAGRAVPMARTKRRRWTGRPRGTAPAAVT